MSTVTSGLPVGEPVINDEQRAFWEGLAEGRLRLPRCLRCSAVIWYPRALCSECGGTDVEWFDATGRGTIYSFTVVHHGEGDFRAAAPFVVAYVELEEGPRVLTNLLGDPGRLAVGDRVRAVYDRAGEGGQPLLRFAPER